MYSTTFKFSFLFLFFSLFLLNGSSAIPREFSIIGNSEEDLTSSSSSSSSRDDLIDLFESWMIKHSKAYGSFKEQLRRFEVFADNLRHIDETNQRPGASYWLGLNEFADLGHEEFKAKFFGLIEPEREEAPYKSQDDQGFTYYKKNIGELPKSVDWRKKGAVTYVKNQGACGSCWAFSTVAAVEGINQIVTGNLTALSEQELIDCDKKFNNGCNGGLMDYAFSFIAANGGLRTEQDYPYLTEEGTCEEKRGDLEVVTISGYEDVPRNSEESLLKALAHQPVSVAIAASGRDFQFYKGGVFDGHCGTQLDHGVTAVGYGTSNGQDYIIVKNSWGAKWGEKGYIRMKRNNGKAEGICGIYNMASYPTKKK